MCALCDQQPIINNRRAISDAFGVAGVGGSLDDDEEEEIAVELVGSSSHTDATQRAPFRMLAGP